MAATKPAAKKPAGKVTAKAPVKAPVKTVAKTAPKAKAATKAKAAPAPVEQANEILFEKGQLVTFTGFTSPDDNELPDNAEALVEGEAYVVKEIVDDGENEPSYIVEAPNPNFDDSKKASKSNPATVDVDVFGDEISAAEEGEVDDDVAVGDEEENETSEEVAEEEVVEAPAKTTKAKAPAKADPKKATGTAKAAKDTKAKAPAKAGKTKAVQEEVDSENDPELKGMILLTEEEEDAEILELVNGAEDVCALASELRTESAASDFRLGGVLYHVRLSKAYKEIDESYAGNKGFALYAEEQLGLNYRKAMYLIDIYAKFSKYGIGGAKVAELGWTKCQEIARLMTEENAEELVALAEDNTVEALKDALKEDYVEEGATAGERVKRTTFKFRLIEDAGVAVADYLEQARESLSLDSLDQTFEHIVSEWAQEHLNARKATKAAAKPGKK